MPFNLVLIWSIVHLLVECHTPDDYSEHLETFRLPGNNIAAKFSFTTRTYNSLTASFSKRQPHYDLFPKVVGEIVSTFNINELQLSLTQGSWRNTLWGDPAGFSSPVGSEVLVWFLPGTKDPNANWKKLIRVLSGIFCGSFSQIDPKFTVIPQLDHLPSLNVLDIKDKNTYMNRSLGRYGVLPHENVCTENLTPWKKLLPCKAKRGLSQLLNPQRLFSSSYSSVQLKIRHFCVDDACRYAGLELVQSLFVVFNSEAYQKGFSLSKLFQSYVDKSCNLASKSFVTFSDTINMKFMVSSAAAMWTDHNETVSFKPNEILVNRSYFDFEVKFIDTKNRSIDIAENHINIHTYLAGNDQRHGSIVSLIDNRNDEDVRVLYSHVIPWYVRIHFHTLRIFDNSAPVKPESLLYRPAVDRFTPHYFEIILVIKRRTSYKLSIEFEKSLLRWTEYPPDAHHGFYIPAPSIIFRFPKSTGKRIYGEALLVTLPTPDFSMPYNVICLVCTVIALAFGPIHNLTTRRLCIVTKDEYEKKLLKHKFRCFIGACRSLLVKRTLLLFFCIISFSLLLLALPFVFCQLTCNVYCKHSIWKYLCLSNE